jgi:hypothetical protein
VAESRRGKSLPKADEPGAEEAQVAPEPTSPEPEAPVEPEAPAEPTVRQPPPTPDQARESAPDDDRVFPKARMIEAGAGLLGHPPHVVAGALADEDDDAEISVADASEKVQSFLNRELES